MKNGKTGNLKKLFASEFAILVILFVLCLAISFLTPTFATTGNIVSVLQRTATTGVLAIGVTFVIATGGIDLSVGGQISLMSVLGALALKKGAPVYGEIALLLALGILFGLINGFFIARLKFAPFMVTLALQLMTNGMALYLTSGRPIMIIADGYDFFGLESVLEIPVPIWIFAIVTIIGLLLLRRFSIGRKILAIGSNEKGAWFSGISIFKTTLVAYVISGIAAAIAALILTSKLMSGSPSMGTGMELDAIAAVVIGGTSLSGGTGYIFGTVAGALIIEVISNWMTLQGINPFLHNVVKGGIILLALFLDNVRRGKLTKNEFAS